MSDRIKELRKAYDDAVAYLATKTAAAAAADDAAYVAAYEAAKAAACAAAADDANTAAFAAYRAAKRLWREAKAALEAAEKEMTSE